MIFNIQNIRYITKNIVIILWKIQKKLNWINISNLGK